MRKCTCCCKLHVTPMHADTHQWRQAGSRRGCAGCCTSCNRCRQQKDGHPHQACVWAHCPSMDACKDPINQAAAGCKHSSTPDTAPRAFQKVESTTTIFRSAHCCFERAPDLVRLLPEEHTRPSSDCCSRRGPLPCLHQVICCCWLPGPKGPQDQT